MSKKHNRLGIIAAICILVALATPVAAQTFYLDQPPEERTIVGIRALKPAFDDSFFPNSSSFTMTYNFYVSYYLGNMTSLRVELPYTHVGFEYAYAENSSENGVGNILIGVQRWLSPTEESRLVYSFNVRPPTASDNYAVYYVGSIADIYHIGRTLPKAWTLEGGFAYHRVPLLPIDDVFSIEIGPTCLVSTEGADPELLVHYGTVFGARIHRFLVSAEFAGLFLVTEDLADFGDRFDNQLALGMTIIDWPVKPQLFYQFPLDEGVRNIIDGVLGLRLEYGFSAPSPKSDWD